MKIRKKIEIKEIAFFVCFVIVLVFLWHCYFSKQTVRNELYIENVNEDGDFCSSSNEIFGIGITNLDKRFYQELNNIPISFEISIKDACGKQIWNGITQDRFIESNDYVLFEQSDLVDGYSFPDNLESGSNYSISCRVMNENQKEIKDFSLVIYGNQIYYSSTQYLIICVLLIIILIAIFMQYNNGFQTKKANRWTIGIIVTLCLISFIQMPTFTINGEEEDFAQSYALSNVLLGREETDEDGYVYLDESGIRDIGGFGKQNSYRFSIEIDGKNTIGKDNISSLYIKKCSSGLGYLLPAIGISIARLCGLSFQAIIIMGRMMNLLLFILAIFIAARVFERKFHSLIPLLLLPCVISISSSYSVFSELTSLSIIAGTLLFQSNGGKSSRSALLLIGLNIIMIMIYPAYMFLTVLNLFSILNKRNKKEVIIGIFINLIVGIMSYFILASEYGISKLFPWIERPIINKVYYVVNSFFVLISGLSNELLGISFYAGITVSALVVFPLIMLFLLLSRNALVNPNSTNEEDRSTDKGSILFLGVSAAYILMILMGHPLFTSSGTNGTYVSEMSGYCFLPLLMTSFIIKESKKISSFDCECHGKEMIVYELLVIAFYICRFAAIFQQ